MIHVSFIGCSGIWTEGGKERGEGGKKGGSKEGKEEGREGGRKKEEREVPLPQVSLQEVKAQAVSLGWEENEGTVDAQTKAHQNL